MTVGDVDSKKRGSGARYNENKPDASLILFSHLPTIKIGQYELDEFLNRMEQFQLTAQPTHLNRAYNEFTQIMRYHIPTYMDNVIRVWEYGKTKYNEFNWLKGMDWSVPVACAGRHYLKMASDDINAIDDESGQPHWASVICNLQMLKYYVVHYPEGNDLPYVTLSELT